MKIFPWEFKKSQVKTIKKFHVKKSSKASPVTLETAINFRPNSYWGRKNIKNGRRYLNLGYFNSKFKNLLLFLIFSPITRNRG
jgi:hypothetical protein